MPRKAVDGDKRLRSLNLKTTDHLRTSLEDAARVSGRTLTAEVEYRLRQTFDEERFARIVRVEVKHAMAARAEVVYDPAPVMHFNFADHSASF